MNLSAEHLAKLRLARTKNIGPVTFMKLLEVAGSAENVIQNWHSFMNTGRKQAAELMPEADAMAEAAALHQLGGTFLFWGEEGYPERLFHTPDAPPVLSVLGDESLLSGQHIAIVGNRNASAAGMKFSQALAHDLTASGYGIVSGLARGIDTAAHTGALAASGATIAVVAGGVNHIYPPENKELRRRIITHGCIISENPLGTTPTAKHFPRRNRIISGLSLGVVVTEASRHSGSLITARYAGEQGREVFAVPGSPADPRAAGPNHLLKQGASFIESVEDVLASIPRLAAQPAAARVTYTREETSTFEADAGQTDFTFLDGAEDGTLGMGVENLVPLAADEAASASHHDTMPQPEGNTLNTPTARLLNLISTTPTAPDELIRQSGIGEIEALSALAELDLLGHIKRHPNGEVSLA